jgi:hypothetical protein
MKKNDVSGMLVMLFAFGLILWATWHTTRPVEVNTEATKAITAVPSATAVATAEAMLPPGLELVKVETTAYMYHLDMNGKKVWEKSGVIKVGRLIKVQNCIKNYRQVEYQPDLERPGFWRVEWLRCE